MIWNPRQRAAFLLPLLGAVLAPWAGSAQEPAQQPQPHPPAVLFGGVEPLMSEQTRVLDLLRAKQWQDARELARMQFLILAGYVDKYPGLPGTAFALEALAEAGLGNDGSAICLWNAAQKVDPKLAKADLSAFGAPGGVLQSHPLQEPGAGGSEPLKVPAPGSPEASKMRRPEILAQTKPRYPLAARRGRIEGKVIVEGVIGTDGRVSHLKVLAGQPMGLDLAAIEAICEWHFKPATLEGKPVPVYYVLTVNFGAEKAPPPAISHP
jgi:TonB family protein